MLRELLIVLLITMAAMAGEASSMSIFKGEKVCVASAFEGQLFFKGHPLSGAKVVRNFKWKDEKGMSEEAITDENGKFSFPSHWDVLRKILPSQFVVSQKIVVYHGDKEVQIWGAGKMTEGEFDEFNGKPHNLTCEITEKIRRVDLEVGFVGTNCHWETKE